MNTQVTEQDVRRVMAMQEQQKDLREVIDGLTKLIDKVDNMMTHPGLSVQLEEVRRDATNELLDLQGFFDTPEYKFRGLS